MQSLFDPVGAAKLPADKPQRSSRGLFLVFGIVVAVAVVGAGGYFGYRMLFPPQLTARPLPPNPEALLTELKTARDGIDSQTRDIYARIQQFNQKMELLNRRQVSLSQVFLQGLSAEEEQALDELVRQEKDPSYRGILSQVVADMKEIRGLQTRIAELEARLPDTGIEVKAGDRHLKMAETFLIEQHGIPRTRAREVVARLNILEGRLQSGYRVHFYYNPAKDFFGTWVAQGDARRSPLAIVRARTMKLIKERDTAIARGDTLEEKKAELEDILARLHDEVELLETRKSLLESSVVQLEGEKKTALAELEQTAEDLESERNSMFYEADLAHRLRARGVLRVFNRVEGIADVEFASRIDLDKNKTITLTPSQFGIDHIRDIRIIPKFLKEGRELDVKFVDDGTVEVTVLNEQALKGKRVLFVVE